jgi:hypothetical protein
MRARQVLTLTTIVSAALLVGSDAGATGPGPVTVGATPALPSQVSSCSSNQLYIQDEVTGEPGYTTTAGVITSWSVMATNNPAAPPMALKIARQGPADVYTITGSSTLGTLTANRLNTFDTRVPVTSGDALGLFVAPGAVMGGCDYSTGAVGDRIQFPLGPAFPDPPVGTVFPSMFSTSTVRLNLSVRIEPDGDGDGYGDLSQDACPTLSNSHSDCTPPDTFLKTGPTRKVLTHHSTAKVKLTFFPSEASTFTCALDKASASPCPTTFKTKAKPGKHTVTVTAIDAVGNVDPSPLVVKFTVKRTPR